MTLYAVEAIKPNGRQWLRVGPWEPIELALERYRAARSMLRAPGRVRLAAKPTPKGGDIADAKR